MFKAAKCFNKKLNAKIFLHRLCVYIFPLNFKCLAIKLIHLKICWFKKIHFYVWTVKIFGNKHQSKPNMKGENCSSSNGTKATFSKNLFCTGLLWCYLKFYRNLTFVKY